MEQTNELVELLEGELGFENVIDIDAESLEDLCEEANATISDAMELSSIVVKRLNRRNIYRICRI